jgi:hypothetical protein
MNGADYNSLKTPLIRISLSGKLKTLVAKNLASGLPIAENLDTDPERRQNDLKNIQLMPPIFPVFLAVNISVVKTALNQTCNAL